MSPIVTDHAVALCDTAAFLSQPEQVVETYGRNGLRVTLVIMLRDGDFYAYRDYCPHQGRSLQYAPGRLLLDPADRLICPAHGAAFLVSDGACVGGPCKGANLQQERVEVRDDQLFWLETADLD